MVARTVGRRDSEQHVGGGTCLSLTGFRYARRPDLDTRGGSSWEELRALVENPENHLQQLKNIDEKFIEKIPPFYLEISLILIFLPRVKIISKRNIKSLLFKQLLNFSCLGFA